MSDVTLTLEKVRRLEQYVSVSAARVDPLIDRTIDKLLDREASRLRDVKRRLESQVAEFERQYSMVSQDFSTRFATGELGDHVDYMEWASSLAMISNIDGQLTILGRLNNEYDHREAL